MGLKAIVDNINDVEEPFRSLYTERNGKFEITGIEGMRTQADVDRLSSGLEKERNDHKATKARFAPLGDRKIEDVLSALDRLPELETMAAGKMDETKINDIVEGRIKSRLAPVERERDALKGQVAERDAKLGEFSKEKTQRTIQDEVRKAITNSQGFVGTAMEDALLLAERVFEIDETTGRVVAKDGVGVTPGVDPTVWLTEIQPKRTHWWGNSQGGGAGGNRNGASGGSNPFSADNWNMTEQSRIYQENPARAEQMAKSAGTSVGGLPPVRK